MSPGKTKENIMTNQAQKHATEVSAVAAGGDTHDFDFVQLHVYDAHGIPRTRVVSKKRMESVKKHGMGICRGMMYSGINGKACQHPDLGQFPGALGSRYVKPIMDTLVPAPQRSAGSHYRVGQVICDFLYPDGTVDLTSPRSAALHQLDLLKSEFGLTFKSSTEMEVIIRDSSGQDLANHSEPNFWDGNMATMVQPLFMEFISEMEEIGVPVDTYHLEDCPGQFEFTMDVGEGIDASDYTIKFKNHSKVFFKSKGYEVTYMTCPFGNKISRSINHFNHSVWRGDKNLFVDATKEFGLSDLGRHWLAGLVHHAPALLVFGYPTINCYRTVGQRHCANRPNWGADDRNANYRIKFEGGCNTYIECRAVSSAHNPYLVTAAHIAAGLDGLRRKLTLPSEPLVQLPRDLESALQALQDDEVMVKALGQDLVTFYSYAKREFELKVLNQNAALSEKEKLQKEFDLYYGNA